VLVLAVALVGELAVFLTATALVDRPRPPVPHLDAQLPPTSSFPSGHTAAAICLYGTLAALVLAATRVWWRRVAVILAVLLVVAVALARLYRGAHYPTDVLGSVLFAAPWLLVVLHVVPRNRAVPRGT
jgi:undecaprenyl-diphosphatase